MSEENVPEESSTAPPGDLSLDAAKLPSEIAKPIDGDHSVEAAKLASEIAKSIDGYVPPPDQVISPADESPPDLKFKLVYNKQSYQIEFWGSKTVKELKDFVEGLTGVPRTTQKLMFKGISLPYRTLFGRTLYERWQSSRTFRKTLKIHLSDMK